MAGRKLKPLPMEQAWDALEGRVSWPGQNQREPKAFAAHKKAQGLATRITAVGGRAMLGEGDTLGHVMVSFWVPGG